MIEGQVYIYTACCKFPGDNKIDSELWNTGWAQYNMHPIPHTPAGGSVHAAYTAATLELYCLYTSLRSGTAPMGRLAEKAPIHVISQGNHVHTSNTRTDFILLGHID